MINPTTNLPWQDYDRFVEIEIPSGQYVAFGYAAKMTDKAPGGGTQLWIDDATVDAVDWETAGAASQLLPP